MQLPSTKDYLRGKAPGNVLNGNLRCTFGQSNNKPQMTLGYHTVTSSTGNNTKACVTPRNTDDLPLIMTGGTNHDIILHSNEIRLTYDVISATQVWGCE